MTCWVAVSAVRQEFGDLQYPTESVTPGLAYLLIWPFVHAASFE